MKLTALAKVTLALGILTTGTLTTEAIQVMLNKIKSQ
ncbi:superantigen-like protein [Staphylococcus aureus]|nr:superantigen-like protein [Staphylococcus aureus]